MADERIFGIVMMTFVNLMCAGIFCGIGVWAQKRKDPMHFYSGTTVDPKTIADVPAYNRENARLWKQYSVPFWLCAGSALGSIWFGELMVFSIILLALACTVGICWLIYRYHRILKNYKIR